MRDPRTEPAPGDELRQPKRGTIRRVTKVEDGYKPIVYYTSHAVTGRIASESIYIEQWRDWCRRHKVEVVKAAEQL